MCFRKKILSDIYYEVDTDDDNISDDGGGNDGVEKEDE